MGKWKDLLDYVFSYQDKIRTRLRLPITRKQCVDATVTMYQYAVGKTGYLKNQKITVPIGTWDNIFAPVRFHPL